MDWGMGEPISRTPISEALQTARDGRIEVIPCTPADVDRLIRAAMELIASRRLPALVAQGIGNGAGKIADNGSAACSETIQQAGGRVFVIGDAQSALPANVDAMSTAAQTGGEQFLVVQSASFSLALCGTSPSPEEANLLCTFDPTLVDSVLDSVGRLIVRRDPAALAAFQSARGVFSPCIADMSLYNAFMAALVRALVSNPGDEGSGQQVTRSPQDVEESTARERLEDKLRESEQRFPLIVEQAIDGIVCIDRDGLVIEWNRSMEAISGYARESVIGQPIWDVQFRLGPPERRSPKDYERLCQYYTSLLNNDDLTRSNQWVEREIQRPDGIRCTIQTSTFMIKPVPGMALVTITRDITESRSVEDALLASNERFRTLVNSLNDLVFELDRKGRFRSVYGQWLDSRSEEGALYLGRTLAEAFGAQSAAIHQDAFRRALAGENVAYEWEAQFEDVTRYFQTNLAPLYGLTGEITEIAGVVRDFTMQKSAERAERQQRILAEALSGTAAALTTIRDPEALLERVLDYVGQVVPHDAANVMLIEDDGIRVVAWRGYPASFGEMFAQFRFSTTLHNFRTMIATGKSHVIPFTKSDPGWVVVPETEWIASYAGAPIRIGGEVIGFINTDSATPGFYDAVAADRLQAFADQAALALENARLYASLAQEKSMLEQRVATRTEDLFQSKQRVEAILDTSGDAILVTSEDGLITQVNPAFSRLFGYDEAEALQMALIAMVDPDEAPDLLDALTEARGSDEPVRIEITARRKDGATFAADLALAPIISGGNAGIVCNLRDISRHKALERDLRRALMHEREINELKNRIISRVSHEFRTPLTVINTAAGLMRQYGNRLTDEQKLERLVRIESEVMHMARMLEDVLTINQAHTGRVRFEPTLLDAEPLCRQVITDLELADGGAHRFIFTREGDSTLSADERLLRQIVLNLCSNAVKFSAPGTTISVSLVGQHDTVQLRVADQGIGIPEADQAHLFEVFHRGQNVSEIGGTGLGLAIVERAVALHGGTTSFESQVGVGTTFTITLPAFPPTEDKP
jgi:PAS domain S-box-containing protein